MRDVWSKWTKDPESINWEAKSQIDYARHHTFETSCIHCHQNNFPLGLSDDGLAAHLYYERQEGALHRCQQHRCRVRTSWVVAGARRSIVGLVRRWQRHAEATRGHGADVAVLRMEKGSFGFIDAYGARLDGDEKLVCELTLLDGKVVYDLKGITREAWDTLPADYEMTGDPRWDGIWR